MRRLSSSDASVNNSLMILEALAAESGADGTTTISAAQIAEIRETIEELSRHDERQVRARGAENLQRRCLLLHKSISGVSVESSDTASTGEAGDVGVDHLHLTTGYGNVLEEILDHLHSKRAMLHDEVLARMQKKKDAARLAASAAASWRQRTEQNRKLFVALEVCVGVCVEGAGEMEPPPPSPRPRENRGRGC